MGGSAGEHVTCPACDGKRLNATALAVKFRDQSIAQLTALPVAQLRVFLQKLRLDTRETAIGQDLLTEISTRLAFLERVGLSYLGLDRAAPTLSGGETQRLRLAAQLGSNLRGVCYVLDEPTIGCIRATTCCCSTRSRPWPAGATRWWWWSTMRKPYVAPTM